MPKGNGNKPQAEGANTTKKHKKNIDKYILLWYNEDVKRTMQGRQAVKRVGKLQTHCPPTTNCTLKNTLDKHILLWYNVGVKISCHKLVQLVITFEYILIEYMNVP